MTIENGAASAAANDPDMADGPDDSGVPYGWHPEGIMAGVPAMNAAAGQSTLGGLMSPEQIADVDWGENEAPLASMGADDIGSDGGQQRASPPDAVSPVEIASAQPGGNGASPAAGDTSPAANGPDRGFHSATGGKVLAVGWENPQNHQQGYGYRIKVQGDNGHIFTYGHTDPGSVEVQPGDQVEQGQVLGNYGDPTNGRSSGPHTHLEERDPSQPLQPEYAPYIHNSRAAGAIIDPTPYAGIVMPGGSITSPFKTRTFQGGQEFHPGVDLSRGRGH
ncbi:MAG TPA: M23 family metallopeptidase [Rhizomicrobium sp.]|nr:M23 family metallopeptidase [Rhizomicrobium sp.]